MHDKAAPACSNCESATFLTDVALILEWCLNSSEYGSNEKESVCILQTNMADVFPMLDCPSACFATIGQVTERGA